jgi:hypothetical protein
LRQEARKHETKGTKQKTVIGMPNCIFGLKQARDGVEICLARIANSMMDPFGGL